MIDVFSGINEIMKTLSSNKQSRVWFIVIVMLILTGGYFAAGYFMPSREPSSNNQCDYLIEQNRQLVSVLLGVKQDLDSISVGKPISYTQSSNEIIFASFVTDTVPKKMTSKDYQQQVGKLSKQIDSVLIKNKKYLDSLNKKQVVKQKSL